MPCYDASRPATPHPIAHATLPSPIVQDDLGLPYARSGSPYSCGHGEVPRYGSPKLEARPRDLRGKSLEVERYYALFTIPFSPDVD